MISYPFTNYSIHSYYIVICIIIIYLACVAILFQVSRNCLTLLPLLRQELLSQEEVTSVTVHLTSSFDRQFEISSAYHFISQTWWQIVLFHRRSFYSLFLVIWNKSYLQHVDSKSVKSHRFLPAVEGQVQCLRRAKIWGGWSDHEWFCYGDTLWWGQCPRILPPMELWDTARSLHIIKHTLRWNNRMDAR